jgi:hypothetical protein
MCSWALEIGVNAISIVICMLVRSARTSSFPQTLVTNYTPYLSPHIFIHLSASSNVSLPIPYALCGLYLLVTFYFVRSDNFVLEGGWVIVFVCNEDINLLPRNVGRSRCYFFAVIL